MKVTMSKSGYDALAEFLAKRWGWQTIEELPEIELTEVEYVDTPAGFQLTNAGLFSKGCLTVLRDVKDRYYTAWGDFIPFRDWREELKEGAYTQFGVFTNPKLLHSDLTKYTGK